MKCKFCREEIPDGVKFCPMCGSVVREEASPADQQSNQQEGYYGQQPDRQGGYDDQQSGRQEIYNDQQPDRQGVYDAPQPDNGNNYGYQYGMSGQNVTQTPQQPINGTLYMVFSVLSLLLCCLPLGIVSIVFSSKINSQQKNGDFEGARESAKKAKIFLILSLVLGLIVNIAVFGFTMTNMTNGTLDVSDTGTDDIELNIDEDNEGEGEDGLDGDLDIGDKEIKPAEQVSELGDNWDSYTVKINDHVIALPCEYKDFEKLGLTIDKETGLDSEDGMVSGEGYSYGYAEDKDGNVIMAEFINPDSENKKVEECLVGGISIYDTAMDTEKLVVVFPGNVQIGTKKEEVVKKYGETEDVYESEDGDMYSWYSDDSYYSGVDASFDADSGKLTYISIRNYGE